MNKSESSRGFLKRPTNIFYGWWIVAISLTVDALKHGTFQRGFSVYVLPIERTLGINRAAISLGETFGRLEGGIQGPLVGYLIDRLGPRTMMAAAGVLSGLGFILLSFTNNYLYFLLIYVGLLSVASRAGYNNASIPAVNQWFRRKRSLAMSIVSTGQGLGCAAITPLVGLLVYGLGWRTAALVSGLTIMAIVPPLSLLVRRSPESMGLLPDGARAETPQPLPRPSANPPNPPLQRGDNPLLNPPLLRGERGGLEEGPGARENPVAPGSAAPPYSGGATAGTPTSRPSGDTDFTAREAMRTPSYWLFVLAVALRNSVHSGVSFHMVPLMVWSGVSERTAALFVSLMCFHTLIFNPFMGWLGDKHSKPRISAVAMIAGSLALVTLLYSGGRLWPLVIFVILLAMSEGANPLAWAIVGDFFGRRAFATLRGWQHLPDQLMSMSTPVWMGWVFDRTDSYFWALVPLAIVYGLSAFFYWTLPSPKLPARLSEPRGLQQL